MSVEIIEGRMRQIACRTPLLQSPPAVSTIISFNRDMIIFASIQLQLQPQRWPIEPCDSWGLV